MPKVRVEAEMSYPASEVRGGSREEQPHVQGAAAEWAHKAKRSYSTFKVRRGGCEEILLVPGAAMKRYPTSKVRETQVRR